MRSLVEVRADFDDVDDALLRLVQRRLLLAREAGAIKRSLGLPVTDLNRETDGRTHRTSWCEAAEVNVDVVERLFAVLLDASRAAQS